MLQNREKDNEDKKLQVQRKEEEGRLNSQIKDEGLGLGSLVGASQWANDQVDESKEVILGKEIAGGLGGQAILEGSGGEAKAPPARSYAMALGGEAGSGEVGKESLVKAVEIESGMDGEEGPK